MGFCMTLVDFCRNISGQIACLDSKPVGGPGRIMKIDQSKFGTIRPW